MEHVAFVSGRAGDDDIYVVGDEGIRKLTGGAGADFDPAWSPDSTKLAFASSRGGDVDLYVMLADGSQVKRLTAVQGQGSEMLRVTPYVNWITFESSRDDDTDIFVTSADGSAFSPLAETEVWMTSNDDEDFMPAWSPDGASIVFASDRDGDDEIWSMRRDGSAQVALTRNTADDWGPAWSADGARIAFVSNRRRTKTCS